MFTSQLRLIGPVAVLALAVGCSDSTNGSTNLVTASDLQERLGEGATRVEVELLPGTMDAREIELRPASELLDEEWIESEVLAIDGSAGTVTLALGNLTVSWSAGARFRQDGGDDLSEQTFVAAITDTLSAGGSPFVRAERIPGAEPQAPGDATFVARRLRIEDRKDAQKIEINVDVDNFGMVGDDGVLVVLGLEIGIVAGVTSIEDGEDSEDGIGPDGGADDDADIDDSDAGPTDQQFNGTVIAVDQLGRTIELASGMHVFVPDALNFDPTGDVFRLEDVAAAVTAGKAVRAEGSGVITDPGPPVSLTGTEIKVEIDNQ